MALIGYSGSGGFQGSPNVRQAWATKFSAPSSFTPLDFYIKFSEEWGASGTVYVAIYSDNSGSPGTKLWDGSASYSSLFNGWKKITMTSPPSLTSGTSYWLAVYLVNSGGTFNTRFPYDAETGFEIKKWTEPTAGSWTDNPTLDSTQTGDRILIYATNERTVSHITDSLLKKALSLTHTTDALQYIVNTLTHTTDAFLQALIGQPSWVSPADGATAQPADTPLVFNMPSNAEYPMHFHIQVDTVNTFNSVNLKEYKSWMDQTGWEYYNGSSWVPIPATGVPTTYVGNQARYTPSDLTEGTWYRRVRGRVANTTL